MSKARSNIVTKLIVVATLVLFMVAQHPGVLSSEEAVKATTAVKHKPLKHFVAGHRISVEAKVSDPQGVSLVRCYFRAAGQADYVFVGMKAGEKDAFTGVLPSPAAGTKSIEYLFLAVNGKNQVVKTQAFKTELKPTAAIPDWQKSGSEGAVAVGSELVKAKSPAGFDDSITFDVVESSARFGFVARLYDTIQVTAAGGSTGAATGGASASASAVATGGAVATTATGAAVAAVSAGTVSASAGVSTVVLVGAGTAVVAVGAGAAVAAAGDSGGGSDQDDNADTAGDGSSSRTGCEQYAGNWTGSMWQRDCTGDIGNDSLRMLVQADCSCNICSNETNVCFSFQIAGNTLSSSEENDNGCGTTIMAGTFTSPTSFSGTFSGAATGTWELTKD